jgi:hypothetical protein
MPYLPTLLAPPRTTIQSFSDSLRNCSDPSLDLSARFSRSGNGNLRPLNRPSDAVCHSLQYPTLTLFTADLQMSPRQWLPPAGLRCSSVWGWSVQHPSGTVPKGQRVGNNSTNLKTHIFLRGRMPRYSKPSTSTDLIAKFELVRGAVANLDNDARSVAAENKGPCRD